MRKYQILTGARWLVDNLAEHPYLGSGWRVDGEFDPSVGDLAARLVYPEGDEACTLRISQNLRRQVISVIEQRERERMDAGRTVYHATTGSSAAATDLDGLTGDDWILRVGHLPGSQDGHVQLVADDGRAVGNVSVDPAQSLVSRMTMAVRALHGQSRAMEQTAAGAEPARPVPAGAADAAKAARQIGRALTPTAPERVDGETLREIPLGEIGHFPGGNIREQFDGLDELAASIRENGVVEPLIVNERDGRITLIAGERRLRAAGLAGLATVPCVVRHLDDKTALEQMLVENLHRRDLNPVEEARAYQRLLTVLGDQGSVAERVGKSRVHVVEYLQLLELPVDLQHQVATRQLPVKAGLEYLRRTKEAPEPVKAKVAEALKAERPTTREAPRVVERVLQEEGVARATPPKQAAPPPPDPAPPEPPQEPAMNEANGATVLRASVLRQAGRDQWPQATEAETIIDVEAYLPVAAILDHWTKRLALKAGFLPRAFGGTVEIHIPEQGVWIKGRESALVKQPAEYTAEELGIVLARERLIVQCVGGRVESPANGEPVYYRVALYAIKGRKLLRQQVVIRDGARRIVVTGNEGNVNIQGDQVEALKALLQALAQFPNQ